MTVFQTCVKAPLKDDNLTLCQSVCGALWSCSKDIREQDVSCVSESIAITSHLVDSQKETLVIPLLGIVEECASLVCRSKGTGTEKEAREKEGE